jgi:hypothetical protein
MARSGRKRVGPSSDNAWESMLDRAEGAEPTQAGEVSAGFEEGLGGGDKGRDTETGSGGYGGDAVLAGNEGAAVEPGRPADAEIHGDPRTPEGSSYPDDAKRSDLDQKPIGASAQEESERSQVARQDMDYDEEAT